LLTKLIRIYSLFKFTKCYLRNIDQDVPRCIQKNNKKIVLDKIRDITS
jgi:retron-type reverse transcriptase